MGDYLEAYAARFNLPVRTGVAVNRLTRKGRRYVVSTNRTLFEADHVVVAMANIVRPKMVSTGGPLIRVKPRDLASAMSSTMIHGVGRDADHVAEIIAARSRMAA